MRISDWSSDVCSSDLAWIGVPPEHGAGAKERVRSADGGSQDPQPRPDQPRPLRRRRRIPPQHVAPALAPLLRSGRGVGVRSEEHTSELQSLMRISYAVFCLKKKKNMNETPPSMNTH